jgi:hypothetical protein
MFLENVGGDERQLVNWLPNSGAMLRAPLGYEANSGGDGRNLQRAIGRTGFLRIRWLMSANTIKHSVEMRSLSLSAPARPRKPKIHGHVREVYGWGTWIRTKIARVRVRCSTVELSPTRWYAKFDTHQPVRCALPRERFCSMLRNDFLEESAKRRNVPLTVVEVVEQLASCVLLIRSKRLVKGTARRDHGRAR